MQTATTAPQGVSPSPNVLAKAAGEYLTFRLGAESYGIEILSVQEIRGYELPTRMVTAPGHVLGVQNLRGVIVPILDLRLKFGMPEATYDIQTVTIVLSLKSGVVGMVVDAVSDVVAVAAAQIRPAPEFSGAMGQQSVIGIATVGEQAAAGMVILLDIEQLMSRTDMGLGSQAIQ